MRSADAKAAMLGIAAIYDQMALRAADREQDQKLAPRLNLP